VKSTRSAFFGDRVPVEQGHLVIVAVRVVVSLLAADKLVTAEEEGNAF
jgi:hypothetical protein